LDGPAAVSSSGDGCDGEYGCCCCWITSCGSCGSTGVITNGGGELTRTRRAETSDGMLGEGLDEEALEKDELDVEDRLVMIGFFSFE
jgi:hypothetical protein